MECHNKYLEMHSVLLMYGTLTKVVTFYDNLMKSVAQLHRTLWELNNFGKLNK